VLLELPLIIPSWLNNQAKEATMQTTTNEQPASNQQQSIRRSRGSSDCAQFIVADRPSSQL